MTENQVIGEHLLQLARALFGVAAKRWFSAIGIELTIGLLTAIIALSRISGETALWWAVIALIAYAIAYVLRLVSEQQYDFGETLRRQSVLSEALDWDVSPVQLSIWEQRAGSKLSGRVAATKREPDYYASKKPIGPARLAEMTAESAFYTRHLYERLSRRLAIAAILAFVLAMIVLANPFLDGNSDVTIKTVVIMLLPLLVSLDIVGWAYRLHVMSRNLEHVEMDIERLEQAGQVNTETMMRLVSEYNCIVVQGIPILDWWFFRQHDDISNAWKTHKSNQHHAIS